MEEKTKEFYEFIFEYTNSENFPYILSLLSSATSLIIYNYKKPYSKLDFLMLMRSHYEAQIKVADLIWDDKEYDNYGFKE